MNPYNTLNVNPDDDQADIKKAYRKAAASAHPDREGGDAEKFHEIRLAYEVLSDPERRQRFDETGETEQQRTTQSMAEVRLVQLFNTVIQQESFNGDIIGNCRQYINDAIRQTKAQLSKLNLKREKLEKQLGRIKTDGDHNLYEQILSDTIAGIVRNIEAGDAELALLNDVSELVENYSDSRPEHQPQAFTTFGTATSSRW